MVAGDRINRSGEPAPVLDGNPITEHVAQVVDDIVRSRSTILCEDLASFHHHVAAGHHALSLFGMPLPVQAIDIA